MRMLGDFVEQMAESHNAVSDLAKPSRIGMVSTAGDRRDEDLRELGAVAAEHFDVLVVREDAALRGRERGDVATLVAAGAQARMAEGARCKQVEIVLEEIAAVHHCMARANPGDLVVLCVDKHGPVLAELETLSQQAQAGTHVGDALADPDLAPPNAG